MRHSENVTPGREVQAFDRTETQRGKEGGRETLRRAAGPVASNNTL